MSELITARKEQADFRWQLLATVSALAMTGYIATSVAALAEEPEHPTVWIELGGQMEMMQGTGNNFTAPFMSTAPEPDAYDADTFSRNLRPARSAFGLEGKLTFQPEDSLWSFSANLRYGRSHSNRHGHQQGAQHSAYQYNSAGTSVVALAPLYVAAFADTKLSYRESHLVLDFSVGRDVGIGLLGSSSSSSINAGVRFAQFSTHSDTEISARPSIATTLLPSFSFQKPWALFNNYTLSGNAQRNFHGIGPSLSWDASAGLLGNAEGGELTFDWGVNVAVLFGRQSANVTHNTQAYHLGVICKRRRGNGSCVYAIGTQSLYSNGNAESRSNSVVVPNLGGFAGISVKYPNVKVSLGYRADFFFGAVDAGIDARQTKDLGFNGPFATISIGLGG